MLRSSFYDTPIEFLKGVGPQKAELLKKELGIFNFHDFLFNYPYRYVDRSKFQKVNEVVSDSAYVQIKGKIRNINLIGKQRTTRMTAWLEDETGKIELVWFQGIRWLKDKFKPNTEYVVFGKPIFFQNRLNIPHPEIEPVNTNNPFSGINNTEFKSGLQPFYSSTEKLKSKGLDSKGIGKLMKNQVVAAKGNISEVLTDEVKENLNLIGREEALLNIHFPENQQILDKAIIRLKFEELFFIQLRLLKLKIIRSQLVKGNRFVKVGDYLNTFYKEKLPFELTNAQKKVVREIRADLGSGKQMNRLLQGDVGSGKTLVALMSMLIALDNNFQACLLAPTEILANQHYNSIKKITDGLNVNIKLLTGSVKGKNRNQIYEELQTGVLQILVGTHALIEEAVQFQNLGLVVIDEQHRFGVEQRAKMWKKSIVPPHILVMTATPIPRTLAMTLYGDLDISIIDELPPGRKPVKTIHMYESQRLQLFKFMKDQIHQGRQIYVVYPLIHESEKLDLKHLEEGYEMISQEFPLPNYVISVVHGQLKPADRDFEMKRFIDKVTHIMVSTTVIEVGVDVPNASVMIIEDAQRFGLSQLHQLRGRVGRGAEQSYCILVTDYKLSNDSRKRIDTMVKTTDGFVIAEEDLKLRGPGDIEGTQQSGLSDLKLVNLARDEKMITYSRKIAFQLLEEDPELEKEKNKLIAQHLNEINKIKQDWGKIS